MINAVGVLFINGFEEIEAITIVDVLRRAKFEVIMVGVDSLSVTGSHEIEVSMDKIMDDVTEDEFDAVVLPGGMPGAVNLANHKGVLSLLQKLHSQNKPIGAICAAPIALHSAGLVQGKRVTCYPTVEQQLSNSTVTGDWITIDGNIITGKGAGVALPFSLKLVEVLGKPNLAADLKQKMIVDYD